MTASHNSLITGDFRLLKLAEGVGFEPTEASASAVFKTGASPGFAEAAAKIKEL